MWLPRACPRLGTWPATQACALTGNQSSGPLVRRPALNPLSHSSQGEFLFLLTPELFLLLELSLPCLSQTLLHPDYHMDCITRAPACGRSSQAPSYPLPRVSPQSTPLYLKGPHHSPRCPKHQAPGVPLSCSLRPQGLAQSRHSENAR